jgi:hypothetical protein
MQIPAIQHSLGLYQQWKMRLIQSLQELDRWLGEHRRFTPRAREQLRAALDVVRGDRLTVALLSEPHGGGSELINSLFSSETGWRPFPSPNGTNFQCPTELLWDDQRDEAYLSLLPAESWALDASLADLRGDPKRWVRYPLNVQAPEQMAGTLREMLRSKIVSTAEASRIGLSRIGLDEEAEVVPQGIEIPKWRYAVVSVPHPLLRQGLVVRFVPGATALAREAELATSPIFGAQAMLLVLSAEDGVARSDLQLWQRHLDGLKSAYQGGILVALNEPDRAWDRLRDAASIERSIAPLREIAAAGMGIEPGLVFPVSTDKGQLGKARKDDALLRRSGLPALERELGRRLLAGKHRRLVDAIEASLGQVLEINRARIATRMERIEAGLRDLEALRDRSGRAISQLLETTRREQELYLKGVQAFQRSREGLLNETRFCRQVLEAESIEAMIDQARRELAGCWTSVGLGRSMRSLFEEFRRTMQTVASESERIRRLVRELYQTFHDDYGFEGAAPKVFIPMKYSVEAELLLQEVEAFRHGPALVLTSPGRLIRRFDQEMVSRARVLFEQLRTACDGWIREALEPLAHEIGGRKAMIERRLESLQRIERSKERLQARIDQMQRQHMSHAQDLTALRNIHNALHYEPRGEPEASLRPRLVSG